MQQRIVEAYHHPDRKVCFYTGQNDRGIANALGLKSWDWTPQKSANVEPWFWNTHTMALAFGCQPVFTSEGKEWIGDRISDVEQVADIKIPNVREGRTGEILQKMAEMLENLPADTLIRLPDIQSPLGVAELMWDQSFYMALLTNPEEVHQLLEKISFNYINRITRELGPLFYHSCTWTDPYFENIEKLEGVRAVIWSFGTSADPAGSHAGKHLTLYLVPARSLQGCGTNG